MDGYFLSKDEWDTLVELGVGDHKDEGVLKKISTATKTSFTKKCVVTVPARLQWYLPLLGTTPETILCHSTRHRI